MPSINRSQIGNWHGLLNIRIDALTVLLGHREIAAVNRIVPYLRRAGAPRSGCCMPVWIITVLISVG
jgi:hypothetical protein